MFLKSCVKLSKELLEKYSVNIPRYTSYPTAPEWTEEFKEVDFLKAANNANDIKSPVSLYFHLPFCESQCYFCGCNVVISKKKDITSPYLEHIKKEIINLGRLINKERTVEQIHLGGGTPTFFSPHEIADFYKTVRDNFNISDSCEAGIEVDPRVTSPEHIETLSKLGFNRISMGIQDFNPVVQSAINRIQSYEDTEKLISHSRIKGFKSVNIDLIYGLPFQTKETFAETIDSILKLNPDRIALFHYAHLPQMIHHQGKYISEDSLPQAEEKIRIFQYSVDRLAENGYVFIGLDHFAKPDDELAVAKKNKTLHRNFQGYTTKSDCDLYGLGITAISNVQNTYSQNIKKLNPYYEAVGLNNLPVFRGISLNKDDILRKEIIMKILCHGRVIKSEFEKKYNINFDKYFSYEMEALKELEDDELVLLNPNIEVTNLGQFFLRNIACIFDHYLQKQKKDGKQKKYSKAV
jgi:oxygen-independent coproporphyrinogen-3 oxidase